MSAIQCTEVCARVPSRGGRPERRILDDVSLTIEKGEFVAVVGPSGAGKSSLITVLAGLDSPSSGTVMLLGTPLARLSRHRLAAFRLSHLSLVLQGDSLFSALTCRENVGLPLRLRGRGGSSRREEEVGVALEATGMSWAADLMPAALSGGERQRIAIARMLATPADIVLTDEPTASLDSANADSVGHRLRMRANASAAVLMVTHDLEAAARADRVLVLSNGRLLANLTRPDRAVLESWARGPAPRVGFSETATL